MEGEEGGGELERPRRKMMWTCVLGIPSARSVGTDLVQLDSHLFVCIIVIRFRLEVYCTEILRVDRNALLKRSRDKPLSILAVDEILQAMHS